MPINDPELCVGQRLYKYAETTSSCRSLVVRGHPSDKKGEEVKIVRPSGGVELWKMLGRPHERQQEGERKPKSDRCFIRVPQIAFILCVSGVVVQ